MRKMEFRIWDKELKEMNYLSLEDLCEDDYWYDGETSVWSVLYDCNNENERFVINQYTGLEDKNGKKIFEGDICKGNQYSDKDNLFVIKYGKYKTKDWKDKYISNTYQFGWYAEFIESKEQVHLVIPNGIEVIGNIFDEKE